MELLFQWWWNMLIILSRYVPLMFKIMPEQYRHCTKVDQVKGWTRASLLKEITSNYMLLYMHSSWWDRSQYILDAYIYCFQLPQSCKFLFSLSRSKTTILNQSTVLGHSFKKYILGTWNRIIGYKRGKLPQSMLRRQYLCSFSILCWQISFY